MKASFFNELELLKDLRRGGKQYTEDMLALEPDRPFRQSVLFPLWVRALLVANNLRYEFDEIDLPELDPEQGYFIFCNHPAHMADILLMLLLVERVAPHKARGLLRLAILAWDGATTPGKAPFGHMVQFPNEDKGTPEERVLRKKVANNQLKRLAHHVVRGGLGAIFLFGQCLGGRAWEKVKLAGPSALLDACVYAGKPVSALCAGFSYTDFADHTRSQKASIKGKLYTPSGEAIRLYKEGLGELADSEKAMNRKMLKAIRLVQQELQKIHTSLYPCGSRQAYAAMEDVIISFSKENGKSAFDLGKEAVALVNHLQESDYESFVSFKEQLEKYRLYCERKRVELGRTSPLQSRWAFLWWAIYSFGFWTNRLPVYWAETSLAEAGEKNRKRFADWAASMNYTYDPSDNLGFQFRGRDTISIWLKVFATWFGTMFLVFISGAVLTSLLTTVTFLSSVAVAIFLYIVWICVSIGTFSSYRRYNFHFRFCSSKEFRSRIAEADTLKRKIDHQLHVFSKGSQV